MQSRSQRLHCCRVEPAPPLPAALGKLTLYLLPSRQPVLGRNKPLDRVTLARSYEEVMGTLHAIWGCLCVGKNGEEGGA